MYISSVFDSQNRSCIYIYEQVKILFLDSINAIFLLKSNISRVNLSIFPGGGPGGARHRHRRGQHCGGAIDGEHNDS